MNANKKRLTLELSPEERDRLQAAAARKGVSMRQYCRSAINDALAKDDPEGETFRRFDIEGLIALRKQTFGDRVLPTDSAEIIREQRELRSRHLESLAWPDSS